MTNPNYVVYCLTCIASGKRYIGITKRSLGVRYAQHVRAASRGPRHAIHLAIAKYGPDAFTKAVIDTANSIAEASAIEKRLIRDMQTLLPNGYNMTIGGEGMVGLTPESKARHAESLRAAWRDARKRAVWQRAARRESRRMKQSVSIKLALRKPLVAEKKRLVMRSPAYAERMSRALTANGVQDRRRAAMLSNGTMHVIQCVETGDVFLGSIAAQRWLRAIGKPKALQCAILLACKSPGRTAYGLSWRFVNDKYRAVPRAA